MAGTSPDGEVLMMEITRHHPRDVLMEHPALLRPLWLALFDHHVAVGAAGMPTRERGTSWGKRRAHYLSITAESPLASLWIATDRHAPVAYALSYETDDTSAAGAARASDAGPAPTARLEVLETLSLLPKTRGQGLGAALLSTVEDSARNRGVGRVAIDVLAGNHGAERFYARAGYRPHSTTLMRSRHAPTDDAAVLHETPEVWGQRERPVAAHQAPGASAPPRQRTAALAAIAATLSGYGVSLTLSDDSDDTWETSDPIAVLTVEPETEQAPARAPEQVHRAVSAATTALAELGIWTSWVEIPGRSTLDGASPHRAASQEQPPPPPALASLLLGSGYLHGMSRVAKPLTREARGRRIGA